MKDLREALKEIWKDDEGKVAFIGDKSSMNKLTIF